MTVILLYSNLSRKQAFWGKRGAELSILLFVLWQDMCFLTGVKYWKWLIWILCSPFVESSLASHSLLIYGIDLIIWSKFVWKLSRCDYSIYERIHINLIHWAIRYLWWAPLLVLVTFIYVCVHQEGCFQVWLCQL